MPTFDRSGRVTASFDAETEAQTWVGAQVVRLAQGLEPERPAQRRRGRPSATDKARRAAGARTASAPSLEAIGRAWHARHYELLEKADAERSRDALRNLELHVFTMFDDLLAYDEQEGNARVIAWARVMAGKPAGLDGFSFKADRTYMRTTVTGYLWLLGQVLDHARALGHAVPDYMRDVRAFDPVGSKKRPAVYVSIARTRQVAAQLHVIHQVIRWLLRLGGLRISEAHGLQVANFFEDAEGDGFLAVEAQGGRRFFERDPDGRVHAVGRKEQGKTDAAYRLVALPRQLTVMLVKVIEAFHTAPNGAIDMTARLVPPIRAEEGGQAGFRNALKKAARATGESDDPDAYVVPHGLRKGYGTDLAWDEAVSALVERRLMGHRAGTDVFDLVYTLDSRLKRHLAPGARSMEAQADTELAGETLIAPTTLRPSYAKCAVSERLARVDAALEEAGWQVREGEGLVTVAEAAAILGRAESTTRRLMGTWIPAVKGKRGEWLASLDDVLAFRERFKGYELLCEVAEAARVTYHQAYQVMGRLGIEPAMDRYSRTLLLTDKDARRIVEEAERLAALRARAMPVAEAATELGVAVSTARLYIRRGILAEDDETDARGTRYVTRASVEAEKGARTGWRR